MSASAGDAAATTVTTAGRLAVAGDRWSVRGWEERSPAQALARDLTAALTRPIPGQPWLPPRWFYDERGSALFENITALPEYYPTAREAAILAAHADEVASLVGTVTTFVELGSGSSTKTRMLLDALTRAHFGGSGELVFVPMDISVEPLADAAARIATAYPTIRVDAMVADFNHPLPHVPGNPGQRLLAFLGGTIGNFDTAGRAQLVERLQLAMDPGDHILIGADLVKDVERLIAAYDDPGGVTAAFNRNLIDVVSRTLGAQGLSGSDFEHEARWNAEHSRVEMWLRAASAIRAHFPVLGLSLSLDAGDELLTELSVKFHLDRLHEELTRHGVLPVKSWTDQAGDFSLTLARML